MDAHLPREELLDHDVHAAFKSEGYNMQKSLYIKIVW